jgi:hypothetical protein
MYTHHLAVPPAPGIPGGGPDRSVEQMQYVFHELHADGQHALCGVCGEPVSGASATVRSEQEILYEHRS